MNKKYYTNISSFIIVHVMVYFNTIIILIRKYDLLKKFYNPIFIIILLLYLTILFQSYILRILANIFL